MTRALADAANETPKPGDAVFGRTAFALAMPPGRRLRYRGGRGPGGGYELILLGTEVEGEARDVAAAHARMARDLKAQGRRAVILSGGELTVTLRGKGRGGPNQEYALALAVALAGTPGVAALAADTDGTDGGGGAARRPGRGLRRRTPRSPVPAALASIRPSFLPTTIRPNSLKGLAIS